MQTIVKDEWRLRIDKLEVGISLRPGCLYVICAEDERLSSTLIWGTLIDACAQGSSACLISMSSLAKSMEESGLAQSARAAIAGKRLAALEMHPSFQRFRGKTDFVDHARVIDEIRYWRAADKQLLVIDGANHLFPHLDADMLRAWRDWAETQDKVVLLVVKQGPHADQGAVTAMRREAHYLTGMARLKSRRGVGSWEIFHWFDNSGLVAGKTVPIHRNANAGLEALTDETLGAAPVAPAADEEQVWAMRSVFLPKEVVSESWQVVDQLDDLLANNSDAVAATVVLAFTPRTDFTQLARCVFGLRKHCGARLKIVIREVNSRLRYSQETLVVRLGANMIVCAEITYSRLLNLILMIQGQIFPYSLPPTYEQAVAEAVPDEEQGYLSPREFCRAVSGTLAHSRILNVQSVLLRLPLAYGLLPLDALRYCDIKRPGDLCSSDEKSVYLFLYACRNADVDAALGHLFGLPASELFSNQELFLSAYGIQEAIDDLDARNAKHSFPDLSAALAGDTTRPERMATKAIVKTSSPAAVRHASPEPAVRRPLSTHAAAFRDVFSGIS